MGDGLVKKGKYMTTPIIVCMFCKNLFLKKQKNCKAFPNKNEIPKDILIGRNKHTKKHSEQENNILFEPISKKEK